MPFSWNSLVIPRDELPTETAKFDAESGLNRVDRLRLFHQHMKDKMYNVLVVGLLSETPIYFFHQSRIPVSRRKEMEGRPLFEMGIPWHFSALAAQFLLQIPEYRKAHDEFALCRNLYAVQHRCVDEAVNIFEVAGKHIEQAMRDCPMFIHWVHCFEDSTWRYNRCRFQQVDFENCMLRKHPTMQFMTFPQEDGGYAPRIVRDGQPYHQKHDFGRFPSVWTGWL
eukprot:TRINITY_DN67441_c0_g1_i1.p2 TRINITY_DN67441_c0_g1~~TRINITY_DN67441_c0_g1_i1.p2  ORF type:complete len:224 (+),score=21.08 TRINITY_DN67441_c0_g1_i1:197-868(+)